MAFSLQTINQVKEKAAFRCCRCQSIGIEAHHIISQRDKGPDTFDNAAPLCPNCHTWFGGNPEKHKEITQMRDWWYKKVEELYNPTAVNYQLLNDINTKVEALTTNQDKTLVDLKGTLLKIATETIDKMTAGTARITASGIANATVVPPLQPQGGKGGSIFIISENLRGNGLISVDGGSGNIGGEGGQVQIETKNNNYTGKVSAKGGDSTKK